MIIWLVFAIIILAFVLIGILWVRGDFTPKTQPKIGDAEIQKFLNEVTEKIGWGPPQAVPGGTRNRCGLYTFPATDSGNEIMLGMPTLDSDTLQSMTPTTKIPRCVSPNQIVARQVQRTCVSNGDKDFRCLSDTGEEFMVGQTIRFFEQCQVKECPGEFGLIALDYSVSDGQLSTDTRCLTLQSGTDILSLAQCDVTKPEQYFQIERRNEMGKVNKNGDFASILHTDSMKCVYPTDFLSSNGGAGAVEAKIKVADCGSANSVIWLLIPPKEVVIAGESSVVPQQIGFTSKLFKINTQTLEEYLENEGLAMFPVEGESVILEKPQLNNSFPIGMQATTQIINYKLFDDFTSWPSTSEKINIPFNTWSFV